MPPSYRRKEFVNDDDFTHINEHRLQDTLDANDRNDFTQYLAAYTADEASMSSFAASQSNQDDFSDISHIHSLPANFRHLPRPLVTKKFHQYRPQYEEWMQTQRSLGQGMAARSLAVPAASSSASVSQSYQIPGAYMGSASASPLPHARQLAATQPPRSPVTRPQASHHQPPQAYPQGLLPRAIQRRELQTSIDEDAARLQDLNRQYKAAASKAIDLHSEIQYVSIRLKTHLLQMTLSEVSTDD
ncbi:hypothetical protein LY78DRAFT_686978 [Colletotrichum sublineola]|nr:hypothetical protein LY78DRAFT_686978 [Colletotrichum sublineola]